MKAQNRATVRLLAVAAGLATSVLLAGCTATSASSTPSTSPSTATASPTSTPTGDILTIDITILNDTVTPSGEKVDAKVGQTVELKVTSDQADEIHAHNGGDGYELEVPANTPTTGSFVISSPGSFEVESHHLEKTIVILNAR